MEFFVQHGETSVAPATEAATESATVEPEIISSPAWAGDRVRTIAATCWIAAFCFLGADSTELCDLNESASVCGDGCHITNGNESRRRWTFIVRPDNFLALFAATLPLQSLYRSEGPERQPIRTLVLAHDCLSRSAPAPVAEGRIVDVMESVGPTRNLVGRVYKPCCALVGDVGIGRLSDCPVPDTADLRGNPFNDRSRPVGASGLPRLIITHPFAG